VRIVEPYLCSNEGDKVMYKVVIVSGIDGSGKTTQIKLLERYLRHRGFKVKRIWFRWVAFVSYPILALCRILGYTKWRVIERSGVRYAERRFYLNKTLARLWPWFYAVDVLIHTIFKIFIWISLGYIILIDRFIPDILIDLMYETKDYQIPRRLVGRLLISLIPKKSRLIIIDVNENTAYNRKHDIPNINYLKERRRLYLYIAKTLSIPVISGEKNVLEVYKTVLGCLKI
jgi:dTMP kinase